MKISVGQILLIALCCQLTLAGDLKGQSVKSIFEVTLDLDIEEQSASTVFAVIEEQTEFRFSFDRKMLQRKPDVTIAANTLGSALMQMSEQLELNFRQVNDLIAVSPAKKGAETVSVVPIDRTISGVITDIETGEALIGATVQVKDSEIGTITGIDGDFSLLVPEDAETLVVSYVGYTSQLLAIGDQTTFNVSLTQDAKALAEVVVVGYGIQEKSDITGSVASVPEKRLEMVPNLNIAQALQGSVPGLIVQQTTGGAVPNQTLLIRGRNSILAQNDPLIVVDGIPYYGNLSDLNVNDVSSIEVLKDASAAAIYGSRGSNGVILVTTKTGESGKPRINFEARKSFQSAVNLPRFLTGPEFYEFKMEKDENMITDTEIENYQAGVSTDWVDIATRNGQSQLYDLSVSGGGEKVNYFVGVSYLEVEGLSLSDQYKRVSNRLNLDVDITDWLTFGTRTQLTFDDQSGYETDFSEIYQMNPLVDNPYNEDGTVNLYPWPEWPDANPMESINYDDDDVSNQLVANNYLNIDLPFVPGLSYRLNTGVRRKFSDHKVYAGNNTSLGIANGGYASISEVEWKNNVIENIASYKKSFGMHDVFFTAVYSYEENEQYTQELTARNFPNDEFSYYGISQAVSVVAENDYQRTALISQMLRANYVFAEKYMLTLTGKKRRFFRVRGKQ